MALFIISIPLMIAAVAIAVIPLIATSHKHHRRTAVANVDTIAAMQHDEEPALTMAA